MIVTCIVGTLCNNSYSNSGIYLVTAPQAVGGNSVPGRTSKILSRNLVLWERNTNLSTIVSFCGRVPAANAPGMHCSRRLIVQTLFYSRSYLHRQVSPPETLVVKGGTTWARNGR